RPPTSRGGGGGGGWGPPVPGSLPAVACAPLPAAPASGGRSRGRYLRWTVRPAGTGETDPDSSRAVSPQVACQPARVLGGGRSVAPLREAPPEGTQRAGVPGPCGRDPFHPLQRRFVRRARQAQPRVAAAQPAP